MDAASSRSFNTKRDEPVRQGRRTEAGTRRLFATARSWSDYEARLWQLPVQCSPPSPGAASAARLIRNFVFKPQLAR